jgi:O-succinylbenzoate synthase
VKLVGIELVRVATPFRRPVGTAAGVHRSRDLLYVRVVTDEGDGWGECAALTDRTSVDPSLDDVDVMAQDRGAQRLVDASLARGGTLPSSAEIAPLFGNAPVDRMLGATFEMAVTDVELRRSGMSLGAFLEVGTGFDAVPVGVAVGIPEGHDPGPLRDEVALAVDGGAARVRLKIAPGWDHQPVAAIRADYPDLVLQVDANGSYRLEDVDSLNRLAEFELLCIEQPLPPADLVAHAELSKSLRIPICLDESLSTPRRVLDAIRNGSCQVACLKPGRLGGIRATRQAHAACQEAGISVFVGGFFESGLGRASNLALAARLAQDAAGLVSDVSSPSEYLEVDPCGYPEVLHGWVKLPDQPGVGGCPDLTKLSNLPTTRRWFPATYT